MNLIIREAAPTDDEVVGELLVRSFTAQFARKLPDVVMSPDRLADLRDQSSKRATGKVLVAELDDRVVGTVTIFPWGAPTSHAWIPGAADLRYLAVDVGYQGLKLSSSLIDAAEGYARDWRVPAICLHVRRGAEGIARLYQSRGYRREPAGDIDLLPQVFLEAFVLRL